MIRVLYCRLQIAWHTVLLHLWQAVINLCTWLEEVIDH